MSEQNTNQANSDGTFNIFDFGSSTPMVDPFAGAEEPAPEMVGSETLAEQQAEPEPPPIQQEQAKQAEAKQSLGTTEASANPLATAVAQAEQKQAASTAEGLFSKAPVFEYAAATEEIKDVAITFDQLRIEKAADFPELDDGKRVSWTMEYGKITKTVSIPNKTVISTLKKEIENSKEFVDALIKAKDKDPICKVKPRITAQSKGIADYKGVFATLEDAEESGKPIRILPARDGNVYEIRCTEVGKFTTRAENAQELSEVSAGFAPALPPIPFTSFAQILAFFRYYMRNGHETEVMVHAYWDKEARKYRIVAPMQSVSKAYISVVVPPDEALDGERFLHVADIHSHNSMRAFFSSIDDYDERATRVYMVVGRLDRPVPEISARISNGGRFLSIDPGLVMETIPTELSADFPTEWTAAVNVTNHRRDPIQLEEGIVKQCLYRLRGRFGDGQVRQYEV